MYEPTTTTTYVRRDIWTLEAADPWDPTTLGYAKAIAEMQTRDAADPTSWAYQAAVHGSYAPVPAGATWNECQHGSWFFLPWHRMYLHYFERIVRSVVVAQGGPAEWALPYWNYDKGPPANSLPPAFRQPTLPDGSGNPLLLGGSRRAAGINQGAALPAAATSSADAFQFVNFSGSPEPGLGGPASAPVHFSGAFGALESTPHNIVHVLIGGRSASRCSGGWMSDPNCAAQDPIFWLHHANIDRLWSAWIARGEGRADPNDPAWRGQSFTFHDETGAAVALTPADVLDTAAQLGYTYDTQPPPVTTRRRTALMSPLPPPERPAELVGATEAPLELVGVTSSVDVTVERAAVASREAAARNRGVPSRYYLRVEDIEADRNPGIGYRVYLNLPAEDLDEPGERAHYVGNVSFFGIEHLSDLDRDHDGPVGLRHVFDITGLVEELRERGAWDGEQFTVTFRPLGLEPPPGADRSVLAPLSDEDSPRVRVGRVSLFAE